MKLTVILTLLVAFLSAPAQAYEPGEFKVNKLCQNITEDQPVLAGGRVKPFYVLAKESVKFITGKSSLLKASSADQFCTIMLANMAQQEINYPIYIEHVDTKKLLKMAAEQNYIGSNDLSLLEDLLRSEIFKLKTNTSYKKDLTKSYNRLATYKKIQGGEAFTFFLEAEKDFAWKKLSEIEITSESFSGLISDSNKNYIQEHGDGHLLELKYMKSHVFSWSILVTLLAIFALVIFKSMKIGISIALFNVALQVAAVATRVMISGRAPITNMYETVMFSGLGALIIALIMLIFKKEKIFLLAGLGYNILCLFMMMFANNMLSSSISPLVPVLRDNFWLSTHVSTIILSYAALALSWLVANIAIIKLRFGKLSQKDYRYYQGLTYTCIKIGVVLLAAGIILGGVWADYSWGRFWGWDPKETWSLIVLLFYIAIMHGRYTNWINTHRFMIASAAGFMTVMMAWFGVNYILASGLHSYGFSEGGAIFLGSFFAIQTAIIILCTVKLPRLR